MPGYSPWEDVEVPTDINPDLASVEAFAAGELAQETPLSAEELLQLSTEREIRETIDRLREAARSSGEAPVAHTLRDVANRLERENNIATEADDVCLEANPVDVAEFDAVFDDETDGDVEDDYEVVDYDEEDEEDEDDCAIDDGYLESDGDGYATASVSIDVDTSTSGASLNDFTFSQRYGYSRSRGRRGNVPDTTAPQKRLLAAVTREGKLLCVRYEQGGNFGSAVNNFCECFDTYLIRKCPPNIAERFIKFDTQDEVDENGYKAWEYILEAGFRIRKL